MRHIIAEGCSEVHIEPSVPSLLAIKLDMLNLVEATAVAPALAPSFQTEV